MSSERLECWVNPHGDIVCPECAPIYTGSRPVSLLGPRTCSECKKDIAAPWPSDRCVACGGTGKNSRGGPCWPCVNTGRGIFPPQEGPLVAKAISAPQHEVKITYTAKMETEPAEPIASDAPKPDLPESVDPYDTMGEF